MDTQTAIDAGEIAKWVGIIAAFGAVVIPQITELLKRHSWPKWAHVLLALLLAGLTGIGSVTVTPASMHDPAALAELAAVAWGAAVVAYHAAWAPSGISDAIGKRTGSLPPIQPAANGSYAKTAVVPPREVRDALLPAHEPVKAAEPAPAATPAEPAPEPEPVLPDPERKAPVKRATRKTGEHRTR